jgi:hypothetical protein
MGTTTASKRPRTAPLGKALGKQAASSTRRGAALGRTLSPDSGVPSPLRTDHQMLTSSSEESIGENNQPSWMSQVTSVSSAWEKRFMYDAGSLKMEAEEEALMVENERKDFKKRAALALQTTKARGTQPVPSTSATVARSRAGKLQKFQHITAEGNAMTGEDDQFGTINLNSPEDAAKLTRGGSWLLRAGYYHHHVSRNTSLAEMLYKQAAEDLVTDQHTRCAALFWHAQMLADMGVRGGADAASNIAFAIDLLQRLVEHQPRLVRARALLATLLARTFPTRLEEPLKHLTEAVKLDPLCPHARMALLRIRALAAQQEANCGKLGDVPARTREAASLFS